MSGRFVATLAHATADALTRKTTEQYGMTDVDYTVVNQTGEGGPQRTATGLRINGVAVDAASGAGGGEVYWCEHDDCMEAVDHFDDHESLRRHMIEAHGEDIGAEAGGGGEVFWCEHDDCMEAVDHFDDHESLRRHMIEAHGEDIGPAKSDDNGSSNAAEVGVGEGRWYKVAVPTYLLHTHISRLDGYAANVTDIMDGGTDGAQFQDVVVEFLRAMGAKGPLGSAAGLSKTGSGADLFVLSEAVVAAVAGVPRESRKSSQGP